MPRFFFHVFDDLACTDDDGLVLPDAAAAWQEAIKSARALASEQIAHGCLTLSHRIEIEDERGRRVSLAFRDAFTMED
jgi:hypothetical protein